MAVTRAKATTLLNKTEMGLYDDSRANALRDHSEARLTQLVTRARTARDRARDLEKRQRLASRKSSGSKSGRTGLANVRTGEKAELLADILGRLETRRREAAKAAKTSARADAKARPAKAAAPKRAPAKAAKAAGKTTKSKAATTAKTAKTPKKAAAPAVAAKTTNKVARKSATTASTRGSATAASAAKPAKKPAAKKPAVKQSTAGKAAAPAAAAKPASRSAPKRKAPADKAGRNTTGRGKRGITPEQALENTRKLLEQHEAEAKASKPWETLGAEGVAVDAPGYQSPQARSKALALHEAETRQASINGSISTRDRRNQGKRDHRNSDD